MMPMTSLSSHLDLWQGLLLVGISFLLLIAKSQFSILISHLLILTNFGTCDTIDHDILVNLIPSVILIQSGFLSHPSYFSQN